MAIVEFLDMFLVFHLKGKILQSGMVNMVFPHVFKTRSGRLNTSYTGGRFTNPSQKVTFWHL